MGCFSSKPTDATPPALAPAIRQVPQVQQPPSRPPSRSPSMAPSRPASVKSRRPIADLDTAQPKSAHAPPLPASSRGIPTMPSTLRDRRTGLTSDIHPQSMHAPARSRARSIADRPRTAPNSASTHVRPARQQIASWPELLDFTGRVQKRGKLSTRGRLFNVYTGENVEDGKKVAIKIVRGFRFNEGFMVSRDCNERIMERFKVVAPAWASLAHSRVVPFLGYAIVDGLPAIINQWCPNGNLMEYLAKFPNANRFALIQQIADGLQYLHTRKPAIVHGDLRPHNVMIGISRKATICDFGLSPLIEAELDHSSLLDEHRGTIRYSAPETFGANPTGVQIDVYSFACLALEIMTGRLPFVKLHADLAVMLVILRGQVPSPEDYPELPGEDPLWSLFQRCWNRDPFHRPPIVEVVQELNALYRER